MIRFLLIAIVFAVANEAIAQQCPKLEILGPPGLVRLGERAKLSITVPGENLAYEWTTGAGTIVEGLGTSAIEIINNFGDLGENTAVNILVEVKIKGLPSDCLSTISAKYGLYVQADVFPIDEYEANIAFDEEKARLDYLMIRLNADKDMHGYIVHHIKSGTVSRGQKEKIAREHRWLTVTRKLPNTAYTIITVADDDYPRTQVWLWPTKGEKFPALSRSGVRIHPN